MNQKSRSSLSPDDIVKFLDDEAAANETGNATLFGFDFSDEFRIAEALRVLRRQINELAPERSRDSDGWIGDASHQNRRSDHNPHVRDGQVGVVTALDITHDPESGCSSEAIAESLRTSRDDRLKYVIWDGQIYSSYSHHGVDPWSWRPYAGTNPHESHVHISVLAEKTAYDSTDLWSVELS